jgi:hypothetical protein
MTPTLTQGLTWQLLLRAEPDDVFAALERAARAGGRVRATDDHERWMVFTGLPGGPGERTRLCAYVREHPSGTLLQFGPPDGRARRPFSSRSESAEAVEVAEAASIGSLVHQMRTFLGSMPMHVPMR